MESAKKFLKLSITLMAAALIFTIAVPRVAHAITATLVYITNTPANPVPVAAQPSVTTVVGTNSADVQNNSLVDLGTYDVSQFSTIRFYGDPATSPTVTVEFILLVADPQGNEFLLDSLSVSGRVRLPSVTGIYQTPGKSLHVIAVASCSDTNCPTTIPANITIFGRQ